MSLIIKNGGNPKYLAERLVHQQDGHRREEGLGNLLRRSYLLKERKVVVALGVIVHLILQNMQQ